MDLLLEDTEHLEEDMDLLRGDMGRLQDMGHQEEDMEGDGRGVHD